MENRINKAVLFAYFSDDISPLQKKSVEIWLAQSGNQELYYQWLHEWELSNLQTLANWEIAFAQTTLRINASPFITESTERIPANEDQEGRVMRWLPARKWLISASVTALLALSSWLYRDALLYQTIRTGFGETRALTLPDGSGVTLNANSSIRYRRPLFSRDTRTVELIGEADFSVRHLTNHTRFVVATPKGLIITVLGTQFTVFSRERSTHVALRSGRVELTMPHRAGQPAVTMRPGDLATLDNRGKLALRQTSHPETLAAWTKHRFSFDQTSLRDIADMLHDNYGLTVAIRNPELASRTVSGSFPAQNANEVLQLVAELLQINYIRDNDHVTFSD